MRASEHYFSFACPEKVLLALQIAIRMSIFFGRENGFPEFCTVEAQQIRVMCVHNQGYVCSQ